MRVGEARNVVDTDIEFVSSFRREEEREGNVHIML